MIQLEVDSKLRSDRRLRDFVESCFGMKIAETFEAVQQHVSMDHSGKYEGLLE